jgi:hypothetical protein
MVAWENPAVGEVCEDGVYADFFHAEDVGGVVDGEDEEFAGIGVDADDEGGGGVVQRDVDGPGAELVGEGAEAAGGTGEEDAKGEAGAGKEAEFLMVEGGDEEIGGEPAARRDVIAKEGEDGEGGVAAFELDIDEGAAGDGVEDFAEEGDGLALACIQGAELGEGVAAEEAAAIGGAIEAEVVEDDEFAAEEVDVYFDAIGAHLQGAADGAEGVFRFMAGSAAMTDDEHGGRSLAEGEGRGKGKVAGGMGNAR